MENTHHVFLSYSRDDIPAMRRIKKTLEQAGITVWTNDGIEVGTSDWQLAIEDAIEKCLCVVCVLSPAAKKSHWVREELVYATFHEKEVYMIHTRGEYKEVAILGFTVAQLIDVRDASLYQPRMTQLCKRIVDELIGEDSAAVTHQASDLGMTQKISDQAVGLNLTQKVPDQAVLDADDTDYSKVDKTLQQPFMPATIPPDETHQLLVKRGKEYTSTSVIEISDTFITMGRDKDSTVHIDDGAVSRTHCQLIYTNDGFLVRDMDSVNGTYINAERIRMRNLKNKDVLQIGPNISLVYRVTTT